MNTTRLTEAESSQSSRNEDLASYVAHELRSPLATQRALLELALGDATADLASWRKIAEDVLDACAYQERLLDACLSLARSQGRIPRREPVDLAAIATEALRAHDTGELESVVELTPAWTSGDPDLLERLAVNLVTNAIRHNVAGGRLRVTTHTEPGRALLAVANTGPPIPPCELDRLFQPFQRLCPPPPGIAGGVGLGLAIVEAIAESHGAVVTAKAPACGGLEIDVAFPALA
jgi:signal transduction histidine kinase